MSALAALTFTTPWLLWALIALPVLWFLLRSVPPAPVVERFPAITLLLGLEDDDTTPAKTPWWLLLLRMLALAALIVGLAGPRIDPQAQVGTSDRLTIVVDASWATAQSWSGQSTLLSDQLAEARRTGKQVALIDLSETPNAAQTEFELPEQAIAASDSVRPQSWRPDYAGWAEVMSGFDAFDTVWLSDGLDHPERSALTSVLNDKGTLTVFEAERFVLGLSSAKLDAGALLVKALRSEGDGRQDITIEAVGLDPSGITRVLAEQVATFEPVTTEMDVAIQLPTELRNRVTRLQIAGLASAGAVVLSDSSLKRKRVGLYTPVAEAEATTLQSPLHYLENALVETADPFESDLPTMLDVGPDVIIMADVATLSAVEEERLVQWVSDGGILVRFAGPRLASAGSQITDADPLLPVLLRAGGREIGGTMSWGDPKTLQDFPEGSPFFGLEIPADVQVSSQVLAQPDPELAEKTYASLLDGTPLVTGSPLGAGQVILFHVTANANWSNLPISVLFVQMLERLSILSAASLADAETLEGRLWTPEQVLDGFGIEGDGGLFAAVDGGRLVSEVPGPDLRPGLYSEGEQIIAFNALGTEDVLSPATWPLGTDLRNFAGAVVQNFTSLFISLAFAILLMDIFASLWVQGSLLPRKLARTAALFLAFWISAPDVEAQEVDPLYVANNTVLAYVITGDRRQDNLSEAGLRGLSAQLTRRTSIEPTDPVGVDLIRDPLELFPFIYWPITEGQRPLDAETVAKVNDFLRTGGMIMFDTRDANLGRNSSSNTVNGRILQQIAAGLSIPPIEPVPEDHVLTRTFYLIQEYPGRYFGAPVWVEAAPADAIRGEGMPFRNLNDGVSPIILGGNDWAAAWAIDQNGDPLRPVGRGSAGEQQREFAYRFGVNLIMYVMTGNYKSDQVHVPALLQRLGN
ncbi:MAG: DUF4159 domain-containing protein [Pseudomonadota bacterium]